ncbi:MAG: TorF family putative porin [Wenzhouxiangella sp.]
MSKHTSSPCLAALLLLGAFHPGLTDQARAELSANIGVVSNYYFRGFSETDGGPAVQGGLDWEAASGFYVGTWASNVDFGDSTSYELDLYLGFANELDNGLGYDFGYLYYAYPDAPESAGFGEIYGELSFGLFSIGAAYVVNDSSDSALETGDLYYHAGIDLPLANEFSLGFLVGRTAFDDSAAENYTHFVASLGKATEALGAFSFNLEYEDTFDKDLKAWVGWTLSF